MANLLPVVCQCEYRVCFDVNDQSGLNHLRCLSGENLGEGIGNKWLKQCSNVPFLLDRVECVWHSQWATHNSPCHLVPEFLLGIDIRMLALQRKVCQTKVGHLNNFISLWIQEPSNNNISHIPDFKLTTKLIFWHPFLTSMPLPFF